MNNESTNGTNGNGDKFQCPHPVYENGERKDHFATRAELDSHGGVCLACFDRIRRKHTAVQHGEPETPADMNAAWCDHESVQTEDFDFDLLAVDQATRDIFADASRDSRHDAGTLLGIILAWCFGRGLSMQKAFRKFVVMTAGLRPDLIGDKSLKEIGSELSITRACMSKHGVNFQRAFHLKFSRGRSEEARRNMSAARLKNPVSRKAKGPLPLP